MRVKETGRAEEPGLFHMAGWSERSPWRPGKHTHPPLRGRSHSGCTIYRGSYGWWPILAQDCNVGLDPVKVNIYVNKIHLDIYFRSI